MKILITGGAGFIGSHTTELFVKHGHEVIVIDNFSTGKKSNLTMVKDQITLMDVDIRDLSRISAACRNIDAVVHLAAVSSVGKSIADPLYSHEINTYGCLCVLEAAKINNVDRVIFASSAAVYGNDITLPKTEDSPVRPLSPYAWHKTTGEFYGSHYETVYDIDFLALRYFNVYGSRQEQDSPYSGVISNFIDRCLRREPLIVFGDGDQTRDFVHVSDVAMVNLLAVQASKRLPKVVNVSSGRETKILEVARIIQKICEIESDIIHEKARRGDILRSFASNAFLSQTFDFVPLVEIEDGLSDLLAEYKT